MRRGIDGSIRRLHLFAGGRSCIIESGLMDREDPIHRYWGVRRYRRFDSLSATLGSVPQGACNRPVSAANRYRNERFRRLHHGVAKQWWTNLNAWRYG